LEDKRGVAIESAIADTFKKADWQRASFEGMREERTSWYW
jgi:hypothetical protein